ncbi:MAG: C40 family peptidase [Alphaproteobacteria bacterium]
MSTELDRRLHPYRDDLAAESLKGEVKAPRYVPGRRHQVAAGIAALRHAPDPGAEQASELHYGETFTVYDERDGWSWGQAEFDGYVGYVDSRLLSRRPFTPTHVVRDLRAFVTPRPDWKAPPVDHLSMNAKVAVADTDGEYSRLSTGEWVFSHHLVPREHVEPDYVATAKRLVGVPYLWGGRSTLGLDCSGLVQTVLERAGMSVRRDSDMQAATLGFALDHLDVSRLERGDFVFWPGHVAIAVSRTEIVHANGLDMMVSVHPVAAAVARYAAEKGLRITCLRRLERASPKTA